MKKRLLILIYFIFFSCTASLAQLGNTEIATEEDSVTVPVGPSIKFEEHKFDFGNIKQGDVVEHTFNFVNNGNQPLLISKVRTTCGCTATNYPRVPVRPGESASISVTFNSAGKRGKQNKVITIDSNAIEGTTQVILMTNVLPPGN